MPVVCKYSAGYKCFYFGRRFCILWRFASSYNRVKAITIIRCVRNGTNGSVFLNDRIFSFNCISVSFFPRWLGVAGVSVEYAVIKGIFRIRLIKNIYIWNLLSVIFLYLYFLFFFIYCVFYIFYSFYILFVIKFV